MENSGATPIFMLDTNAVSDAIRHPNGAVATRLGATLPGQVVTSVIVAGELRYGVAKAGASAYEARLDQFLRYVPVMAIGPAVAATYGRVRAQLAGLGTPIGMNDLWVAAHALELVLTVVTDNVREFSRVPGLATENWQR